MTTETNAHLVLTVDVQSSGADKDEIAPILHYMGLQGKSAKFCIAKNLQLFALLKICKVLHC
jgi:hypothetical protein